jgi:hypothetical protein
MTVASGWDNDVLQEVIIVDPDHEAVAERVFMMLKGPRSIRVVGYDPQRLDNPAMYNHGMRLSR